MPAAGLTNAQTGIPIPLCYGYIRVTGNQLGFITNPPSDSVPPYPPASPSSYPLMQSGVWAGGEGEWDGVDALFINGNRMVAYTADGAFVGPDPTTGTIPPGADSAYTSPVVGTLNNFSFHSGVDGNSTTQSIDGAWGWFNGLVTELNYSRIAYWGIQWTPQIGTSPGNMQPVLDMRTMRCRIFDASGNQVGYQFTTNPIWQLVDLYLRRLIKPQYNITAGVGPTALSTGEKDCFRWDILAESAAYCDYLLPSGIPRFSFSGAFASAAQMSAIEEQILLCCRGYKQEIAGKVAFFIDQPRASTFTLSGSMLYPGTFQADDTQLHQSGNKYRATFLELGLPAVATIETITLTMGSPGAVVIDTTGPNPCAAEDLIIVGGVENPALDGLYTVGSVSGDAVTCPADYPTDLSSTGGSIGYLESRFAQRTPQAPPHVQHELALGQVLPPNAGGQRLKRLKVDYNYANCTWDQAMRILMYERYRDLGADATPYKPPRRVTLSLWSESVDAAGNRLWDQIPGSIITLDPTVFFEFAGLYEIVEMLPAPLQVDPQQQGGTYVTQPSSDAGIIQLILWQFDAGRFFDDVGLPTPSFATVPGTFLFAGAAGAGSDVWTLTGGTITVTGQTVSGGVLSPVATVTWVDVTATAPDGSILSYANGGFAITPPTVGQTIYLYDPNSLGGACIYGYGSGIGTLPGMPPIGAHLLFTVTTIPTPGEFTTFSL